MTVLGAGRLDSVVITVVSDTHGSDGHRLEGRTLTAVRAADLVIHAGDFTTAAVLDAFEDAAGAATDDGTAEFVAVTGNNESVAVADRVPSRAVVERAGVRFVVVHGHEHDDTALQMLGRQEHADVAVVGHSHRPTWNAEGRIAVLNPGSHADPRWNRPAHAELEATREGLDGRLVTPDGEVLAAFDLAVDGRE